MLNEKYVLIVDDSKMVCNTLQSKIETTLGLNCIIAHSKSEAKKKLIEYKGKFSAAIVDLNLPDAQNGEIVGFVSRLEIPTIVLTGNPNVEDKLRKKDIIDFVVKDSGFAFEYITFLVKQILNCYMQKVLIVDDSKVVIRMITKLLKRYNLNCLSASDGAEGLRILQKNKDIKVVFTDYNMPIMDGLQFTKEIRKKYSKEKMAIVAISDTNDKKIVPKFLRYGANDFLYKGFSPEEFFARLNSVLENMRQIQELQDRANKDFLTGAYNRRYFFQEGLKKYNNTDNVKLFILDIDKFKNINDTYGHDIGDIALKEAVSIIKNNLDDVDSITARFGGEEFCTMVFDQAEEEFLTLMEKIRASFEMNILDTNQGEIAYTVSIGYTLDKSTSIEAMIMEADKGLYHAKNNGRNQVRGS